MNEQMRKQLKTWKICTDRYNSNGLVQIYSDISISSKNTIVLIQSTHGIWCDQRLACEVRRFGLVTPRFVILSLAVKRTSCGRQTKFNKRWILVIKCGENINNDKTLETSPTNSDRTKSAPRENDFLSLLYFAAAL